jgi:hypothetical protein
MSIYPKTDAEKAEQYDKLKAAVLAMFDTFTDGNDDEQRMRSAKRCLMLACGLDPERVRAEYEQSLAVLDEVLHQPHNADLRPSSADMRSMSDNDPRTM